MLKTLEKLQEEGNCLFTANRVAEHSSALPFHTYATQSSTTRYGPPVDPLNTKSLQTQRAVFFLPTVAPQKPDDMIVTKRSNLPLSKEHGTNTRNMQIRVSTAKPSHSRSVFPIFQKNMHEYPSALTFGPSSSPAPLREHARWRRSASRSTPPRQGTPLVVRGAPQRRLAPP